MLSKAELYKKKYNADDSPGLDAINKKQVEIYGDQEPTHWATVVPYELGGPDPLWAIESFISLKASRHIHYITLGFTNLWYDEESAEDEINGFGFELTFRYLPSEDEAERPIWPANFLQNIAKYVFKTKKVFDECHYMSANGPIMLGAKTDITALIFFKDPEFGEIETPHGKMKFLQVYGITSNEYIALKERKFTVRELISRQQVDNPLLITDLRRK